MYSMGNHTLKPSRLSTLYDVTDDQENILRSLTSSLATAAGAVLPDESPDSYYVGKVVALVFAIDAVARNIGLNVTESSRERQAIIIMSLLGIRAPRYLRGEARFWDQRTYRRRRK